MEMMMTMMVMVRVGSKTVVPTKQLVNQTKPRYFMVLVGFVMKGTSDVWL